MQVTSINEPVGSATEEQFDSEGLCLEDADVERAIGAYRDLVGRRTALRRELDGLRRAIRDVEAELAQARDVLDRAMERDFLPTGAAAEVSGLPEDWMRAVARGAQVYEYRPGTGLVPLDLKAIRYRGRYWFRRSDVEAIDPDWTTAP